MFRALMNAFKIYQDRRQVAMLTLGFSSGFPLALVVGTLTLWLKDSGIALATIGALSLIKTPFSLGESAGMQEESEPAITGFLSLMIVLSLLSKYGTAAVQNRN